MTPDQRYRAMAHNNGRTRPERALASGLWRQGIRYLTPKGYKSLSGKRLPGNPDLILPRKRILIFVDGCFWHGCQLCNKFSGLSGEFWLGKIEGNRRRDRRVTAALEDEGWRVLRVPEHDIRTKLSFHHTLDYISALVIGERQEPGKDRIETTASNARSEEQ